MTPLFIICDWLSPLTRLVIDRKRAIVLDWNELEASRWSLNLKRSRDIDIYTDIQTYIAHAHRLSVCS